MSDRKGNPPAHRAQDRVNANRYDRRAFTRQCPLCRQSLPIPGRDAHGWPLLLPLPEQVLVEKLQAHPDRLIVTFRSGVRAELPTTARLAEATQEQRDNYELEWDGAWVRWPDVDEDIVPAMLLGLSEDVIADAIRHRRATRPLRPFHARARRRQKRRS